MLGKPRLRVVIARDTCSPLYVLRCVRPCQDGGWCMFHPVQQAPLCWLGSGLTEASARAQAARWNYEVVA
jgi:hypothetical protein